MPTQYTKMIDNNGQTIPVEKDRVERFLSEGWTILAQPKEEKKSPAKRSKNKITAKAQVTSTEVDNEEEWDPLTGEDWADSIESVSAPEGERLSDIDNETANKED